MFGWLWKIRLVDGFLPILVIALAVTALIFIVATRSRRRWAFTVVAGAIGAGIAWMIAWLVSDVWNSFGVSLSVPTRVWFIAAVAAIAVAAINIRGAHRWKRILAVSAIPLFALTGGIGINVDVGQFPAVGNLVGKSTLQPLRLPAASPSSAGGSLASWVPPSKLPLKGRVGTVVIPASVSHFSAREAVVYLPPAALVRDAPALPVMEMLSGQPGAPSNLVSAGALPALVDTYAHEHGGLAPIVVVPDQLGAPESNPMCLDSPLGKSATYLTVDVPNWISTHLHVLGGERYWAIGGFSQGGTCSIQLGAQYPDLFGSILDIAGQVTPHRGSVAATIKDAFGGSGAAYSAAMPLSLLASGAPYRDTLAIFASGQNDTRFGPGARVVADAASRAGMRTNSMVSPGTAHDWRTVQFAIAKALPMLGQRWGLT